MHGFDFTFEQVETSRHVDVLDVFGGEAATARAVEASEESIGAHDRVHVLATQVVLTLVVQEVYGQGAGQLRLCANLVLDAIASRYVIRQVEYAVHVPPAQWIRRERDLVNGRRTFSMSGLVSSN